MKKLLFFISFFIFFFLGLLLTAGDTNITHSIDKIFSMDTSSYSYSIRALEGQHDYLRLISHPFIQIILQPIFYLVKIFTNSDSITMILLQALCSSTNICLIYSILKMFTKRTFTPILFCVIYGISFSTLIFSSFFEGYIYSAFSNLLFLYLICHIYTQNTDLNFKKDFILASVIFFAFGINFINVLTLFCLFFLVLIFSEKGFLYKTKHFFLILLIFLSITTSFSIIEKYKYGIDSKFFIKDITSHYNSLGSITNNFGLAVKIMPAINGIYTESFYALKIIKKEIYTFENRKNEGFYFDKKQNLINLIPFLLLNLFALIIFGLKYKNIDKKPIIFALLSICIINICFYMIYWSEESFLYSQNAFPFLIILLGIIFSNVKKEFVNAGLILFILYQAIINISSIIYLKNSISPYFITLKTTVTDLIFSGLITSLLFSLCYLHEKYTKQKHDLFSVIFYFFIALLIINLCATMFKIYPN